MSFVDTSEIGWSPTSVDSRGVVRFGEDRNMFVVFYRRSVVDPNASQAAGRRICKGENYVRIQPPGERLTVVDRPVTDADKHRWPNQWRQFVDNHQQVPDGTPIDMLWVDFPEVGDTLRGMGIHTVEQCANLSGLAIESIGLGGQEYVNKAKRYLEQAEKGVAFHKHEKDLAERDQKIRLLTQNQAALQEQINKLMGMLQQAQGQVPPNTIPPVEPIRPTGYMLPIPGVNIADATPAQQDIQSHQIENSHPSYEWTQVVKKRGRPVGSKNKPKQTE
jgi:hypothetical protein